MKQVTSSLAAIQRPGHQAHNCKMVYLPVIMLTPLKLPFASFSKRVLVPVLSYENEISFTCKLNRFRMSGCAPRLALMERLRESRKRDIKKCL